MKDCRKEVTTLSHVMQHFRALGYIHSRQQVDKCARSTHNTIDFATRSRTMYLHMRRCRCLEYIVMDRQDLPPAESTTRLVSVRPRRTVLILRCGFSTLWPTTLSVSGQSWPCMSKALTQEGAD